MPTNNSIPEIIRHYEDADEASRLRIGWFQLEQARTQELILRHLPPAPATVVDAGGGAGAYACWLASQGYRVHLIDPVLKHVDQARAASALQPERPLASAEVGDARRLPTPIPQPTPSCSSVRSITSRIATIASPLSAKPTAFSVPAAWSGERASATSPRCWIPWPTDSSTIPPSRRSSRVT